MSCFRRSFYSVIHLTILIATAVACTEHNQKGAHSSSGSGPTVDSLDSGVSDESVAAAPAALVEGRNTVWPDRADALVESIGVGIHASFPGYWQDRFQDWHPKLGELGVRYVRTSLGRNRKAVEILKTLNNDYGIRSNLVYTIHDNWVLDQSRIREQLLFARDELRPRRIVSIEGPNEISKVEHLYGRRNWDNGLRAFQGTLYNQTKKIFGNQMPVLAPSIWRRIGDDFRQLGRIENTADVANLHYYTGALRPTEYSVFQASFSRTLTHAVNLARINVPRAPVQITEYSYNTAVDRGESNFLVPPSIQAKYTARAIADFYFQGIERSYYFNFMDRPDRASADDFQRGLLNDNRNLSRKPVYFAIKNMIRIMRDPGGQFSRNRFTYRLEGNLRNVRHKVFQKRDGRFYFMIWQNVDSYDRSTGREIRVSERRLTLDVRSHRFSSAAVYHPTGLNGRSNNGARPISSMRSPGVMQISVPDQVMIIEFTP